MFGSSDCDDGRLTTGSWESRALVAAAAYANVLAEFTPAGPDGVSSQFLIDHDHLTNRIAAGRIEVQASWDAHNTWADDGARSGCGWLAARTEVARPVARAELRLGRALRQMPATEAAFRAGTLGVAKARLLQDAQSALPEAFAAAEPFLVEQVTKLRVDQARRFLAVWRAMADPDATGDDAEKLRARRGLHLSETMNGMWRLDGELDPESGRALDLALRHLSDQIYRADKASAEAAGEPISSTPSQRRVDAIADMARMAMANESDGSGQAVPSIIVVLDADKLCSASTHEGALIGETADGAPVTAAMAHRLCCDSGISRIATSGHNAPVNLGTTERFPSPAQRRALRTRDRGCVFPGCDRPHGWTHAHHIIYWEHDGPTDLSNLASLCSAHHHLVHEGGFGLQRVEGGELVFTRPDGTSIGVTKGTAPPPLPGWPSDHPAAPKRRPPPAVPPPFDPNILLERLRRKFADELSAEDAA